MTHVLSYSQFGELLAIDPACIASIVLNKESRTITVEESDMSQTTGAFPQLTTKSKPGKKGGKGKRGC